MELNIENFAKIKEANIIIDGITVIAGENNTGKSTVGKILFSIFNSLNNIEDKILKDRLQTIERRNFLTCVRRTNIEDSQGWEKIQQFVEDISWKIEKELKNTGRFSDDSLRHVLDEVIRMLTTNFSSADINMGEELDAIRENITAVMELSDDTIIKEIISSYFNEVFASQINMLSVEEHGESVLSLIIKGKTQRLFFEDNKCTRYEKSIKIDHKAIYIDNPFVVDYLNKLRADANVMENLLVNLLREEKEDVFDGVVEKMLVKEKMQDIYNRLQTVVEGEIIVDQNDSFCLKNNKFKEPIILQNLSTGLKSFVILKLLLEKGGLKEKDVVILDEPEIHLHPQWQIAYAELIVLIQKAFDLSIIVTTHSPYFVDALNLFSCKYETDSRVNYYLSSNDSNVVRMECVNDHIESIYEKMASPIQILDTLRYELNNK